jgi:iron(III) transport system permease protein
MGSFIVLILAYVIRFYAVAAGPMDAAASKLKPSVIEAAKLFGLGRLQQWRRVMQPLLMPGTAVALLMVMVDVMKEMPATLLLRPFGWDTLAVKIYEFTSEGDWDLAAIPALILILLSLIPMVYLMRKIEGEET